MDSKDKLSFNQILKEKKVLHMQAVQSILGLPKYEQRYHMVNKVFEKLFFMLEGFKSTLEISGYLPNVFPNDPQLIDSLIVIVENCALLSEIILKFPDITERLLKNENWNLMTYWCINFSTSISYLDNNTRKLFYLAGQQLKIVEREEGVLNKRLSESAKSKIIPDTINKKEVKKERKKLPKGPRLSRKVEF